MNKRKIGQNGEKIARNFLEAKGIDIINSNYLTKYGEIDLIGLENETIIFIEVKYRNNENFGLPIESITQNKIKNLKNTAKYYMIDNKLSNKDFRFDIVGIIYNRQNQLYQIEWYQNQYF